MVLLMNGRQNSGGDRGNGGNRGDRRNGSGGAYDRRPPSRNGVPLTPEERARREEAMRRRREREAYEARRAAYFKQRQAEERKKNLRAFGGRLLVFFVILLLLCAIVGLAFLIFFRSAPDAESAKNTVTHYYGGKKVRTVKKEDAVDSDTGGAYFCFNDLADYLGYYESGTADGIKFIYSPNAQKTAAGDGSEEVIVFHTDSWSVTVNSQQITLEKQNRIKGEEVWVATQFITDYMINLSCTYDASKGELKIARIKDEEASTKDNTVYLPVSFRLKKSDVIEPIEEDTGIGEVTGSPEIGTDTEVKLPEVTFTADLSSYEKYMNPTGDERDAYLILVNTKNTLTESDIPDDLTELSMSNPSGTTQKLRKYAAESLEALFKEMKADGYYNMMVHSSFRTYSYQSTLFETYTAREMANDPSLTREQAEAVVLTYSTRPGTSEHQTGLACDMDTLGTFTTDFEYEPEYKWLTENAWKFGFILRFPKGKEDVTTIQFEPWHFRYVGRYHAYLIKESGLCLEEYVAKLGK